MAKRQLRTSDVVAWGVELALVVGVLVSYAKSAGLTALFVIVLVMILIGRHLTKSDRRLAKELAKAPIGDTRVVEERADQFQKRVDLFTRHGYELIQQSTAKSLGSAARATGTFKKTRQIQAAPSGAQGVMEA